MRGSESVGTDVWDIWYRLLSTNYDAMYGNYSGSTGVMLTVLAVEEHHFLES